MATIKETFGSGGANLTPSNSAGAPHLAGALRDAADDLTMLRAQFLALLQKLDADAVGGADYETALTPDPLLTIKG